MIKIGIGCRHFQIILFSSSYVYIECFIYNLWMFCVDSIENLFEIRSAEMCFCFQAGEDAPAGHALEVLLTNVLQTNETKMNRDVESEMLAMNQVTDEGSVDLQWCSQV